MPIAHYTGGGTYRVAGHSFTNGDEIEVDRELAEYLADVEDFEVHVEKQADLGDVVQEDEPSDETDEEEAEADEFAVDEFLDRTPVEDVAEDIVAGEVDDNLEAIAEAADRVTVQDAVGERRAELEG